MAAVAAAGFLPPALALVAMTTTGALSTRWAAVALTLGAIAGALSAAIAASAIERRAARIESLADALQAHRQPPHVLPDDGDSIGKAERLLLQAADTVIGEIGALTEQRDELGAILRSMTEAVVVTSARGEVVLLNGQARKTFALGAETNYQGRDFVELCRDPRLQEFVARSMGSRGSQDAEITAAEVIIQNPTPRYLSVSATPVRRASGAMAWLFVFHDITQLKTYETIRADFIANLTHEIRTPLAALYGYAETLSKGVEDKEAERRFLGIIERQARRLARLVDDLLSLSDLERGLTPLKLEDIEPRRVLEEAGELMREQATRGGVMLNLACSDEVGAMRADRDRMHQVMLNLIDNAIKYTPRGGKVTLEARRGGQDGSQCVEIVVSDTGEGIPAADVPRLTERFYRVDRARSRELGGTGLGLAIVKHIVQLHRGTLRIDSKIGEGTSVAVSIPTSIK